MKIKGNAIVSVISLFVVIGSAGCRWRIGPPNDQEELMRPENVVSFDRLYKQNCSACHGENGSGGPALDLANPELSGTRGRRIFEALDHLRHARNPDAGLW